MYGFIRSVLPAAICLSLALGASTALAKGECKGMSKSACSSNSNCSWVKGYVSKSGNKVDAYCRAKGKKAKSAESKSNAKSQQKKAEKSKKAVKEKKKEKSKEGTKKKETES